MTTFLVDISAKTSPPKVLGRHHREFRFNTEFHTCDLRLWATACGLQFNGVLDPPKLRTWWNCDRFLKILDTSKWVWEKFVTHSVFKFCWSLSFSKRSILMNWMNRRHNKYVVSIKHFLTTLYIYCFYSLNIGLNTILFFWACSQYISRDLNHFVEFRSVTRPLRLPTIP